MSIEHLMIFTCDVCKEKTEDDPNNPSRSFITLHLNRNGDWRCNPIKTVHICRSCSQAFTVGVVIAKSGGLPT